MLSGPLFYCSPLFYSSVDELALSMYPPMNQLTVRLNVSICSLHGGLLMWCREGEEVELEGLGDCRGEVAVSDCLRNKFLGMKSPLWFLHT